MSVEQIHNFCGPENQQSADCHLPESAEGEVEVELGTDVSSHDVEDEGQNGRCGQQTEGPRLKLGQEQSYEERPEDVELLLNSQRPQVQKWVGLHVGVPVARLVSEDFDVGSENSRGGHRSRDHAQVLLGGVPDTHVEHEQQDDDERGVNPFDSAVVEVEVGKSALDVLLDEDLSDEVTRNHEEDIDADEPSRQRVGPGMEGDHNPYRNSPKSVDVSSVLSLWRVKRLFISIRNR